MCACALHTEPILLNPVPHCLNTSLESFHCRLPILSLPSRRLVSAREWQAGWVCHQSGLFDWSASCRRSQPSPSGGFCEGIWSGGPHRDVMFQVYSLKGAHEMVDFPGRCHIKYPFVFFLICIFFFLHIPVVSDQVLLPSDLLLKDCFSSHTLTPGLAKTGLRHIFNRVGNSQVSI